jgi:oxygen-independent coproporphyrinogen-3 oxidase
MYEATLAATEVAGFEQYEISNFAKPGQACRHNLLYWRNESWWALGPSASGHVAGVRWKNVPNLTRWLAESEERMAPIVDCEEVDADTRAGEILLVGLRLREGVSDAVIDAACQTGRGPARREAIRQAIERGFLECVAGRVRFTRAGQLLADEVLVELL